MKGAVLLLLIAGVAFPYVVGFHVEPVKAAWSGWTGRGDTVAQSVTCNFDSLSYVELFAGAKGNGGVYRAGVWLDGSEIMWSNGTQTQNESWVKFENWNTHIAYTKGKLYEFRFTRSGRDSVQFYYQDGDPYPYQNCKMIVGGQQWQTLTLDLAMRVYGYRRVGQNAA